MPLGKMRDSIEIHVPAISTGVSGAPITDYSESGRAKTIRIFAQKLPARRLEELDRGREVAVNLTRLQIIFRDDFDEKARVLYRGRLYDIEGFDDPDGGRRSLILTLTLRSEDQID